jgi:Holliday junction resolvasome RuvABC endonuclease subunit
MFSPRPKLRVLGIDPSIQSCGWGVIDGSVALGHGCIRSTPDEPEFARYEKLERAILDVIATYQPEVAAIEEFTQFYLATHGGKTNPKAMFSLKGAQATLVHVCLRAGLGVALYRPVVWKGGNVDKDTVMNMVNARFDLGLTNNDTTDALAIADHFHRLGRHSDLVSFYGLPFSREHVVEYERPAKKTRKRAGTADAKGGASRLEAGRAPALPKAGGSQATSGKRGPGRGKAKAVSSTGQPTAVPSISPFTPVRPPKVASRGVDIAPGDRGIGRVKTATAEASAPFRQASAD